MEAKGYIFDYGGTIDTRGCHWGKMLWHAYERHQVPVCEEHFREAYVYAERELGKNPIIQPSYTFRKTLETKLRIEFDCLEERGYLSVGNFTAASMRAALLDDLYEGVKTETARSREVLTQIGKQHRMVLVSNFYGNIGVVLDEFGLDGLFAQVVESAVVGVRKPDPAIFRIGVEALQMEPRQVVVVGDSLRKDIVPAKQIGCQTVWIEGEGWTDEKEDHSAADHIIHSLAELTSM